MCVVTFDWEENDAINKFKNFHRTHSLSWAVIELTDMCNFNCLWCYANSGLQKAPTHMSTKNVTRLLGMLADAGVKQVTLSGGEPLLYPHIRNVVKEARERHMTVHMNTNGYFLTAKLAKDLHGLGLSQVQINIDSLDPRQHDAVRGKKGSFQKAIAALKNAKEAGITCVSQTVLTRQNENDVVDIFKFARSLGIQRCRVWDVITTGRAAGKSDLRPADYIMSLKKLARFAAETGAKNIESGDPLFPLNYETSLRISGGFCAAMAGLFATISCNGDVNPCATLRRPLYNAFCIDGGMADVHKIMLGEYTSSLRYPSKCPGCEFFSGCKGGCPTRRLDQGPRGDYWCYYQ